MLDGRRTQAGQGGAPMTRWRRGVVACTLGAALVASVAVPDGGRCAAGPADVRATAVERHHPRADRSAAAARSQPPPPVEEETTTTQRRAPSTTEDAVEEDEEEAARPSPPCPPDSRSRRSPTCSCPGNGLEGAQATTTTTAAPSGGSSADDESRMIWMIIAALAGVGLLVALLTWRYWLLTRPGLDLDDEDDGLGARRRPPPGRRSARDGAGGHGGRCGCRRPRRRARSLAGRRRGPVLGRARRSSPAPAARVPPATPPPVRQAPDPRAAGPATPAGRARAPGRAARGRARRRRPPTARTRSSSAGGPPRQARARDAVPPRGGRRAAAVASAAAPAPGAARRAATRRRGTGPAPTGGVPRAPAGAPSPTPACGAIRPAGEGRAVRYGAGHGRCARRRRDDPAVPRPGARRPQPHAAPGGGRGADAFIRQAEVDFQDFAIIGDAEATVEDGVLVLRVDLRPNDDAGADVARLTPG